MRGLESRSSAPVKGKRRDKRQERHIRQPHSLKAKIRRANLQITNIEGRGISEWILGRLLGLGLHFLVSISVSRVPIAFPLLFGELARYAMDKTKENLACPALRNEITCRQGRRLVEKISLREAMLTLL